jgi:hypothetical protein
MPDISTVHIDRALTNMSLAYKNEGYIAGMVAPILPVNKRSDKYFVYNREAFLRSSGVDPNGRPLSIRRPTAEAAEVDYALSTDNYYCEEIALSDLVPYEEIQAADEPLQPLIDAQDGLNERVLLDNEIAVASVAMNTSNYASGNKATLTTGGSGTSWASYASASSLPFSNFSTAKNVVRSGIMRVPNALTINYQAAEILSNHPTYTDRFKYTTTEIATKSGLVPVIRGLEVIEGTAIRINSAEGASTVTTGDVWVDSGGNAAALVHFKGTGIGPKSMHFMRTFEAPDAQSGMRGLITKRFELPTRGSAKIQVSTTRDWKGVAVDSNSKFLGGYLFLSCVV